MSSSLVPEEIIREILLWLPAKSLGRFITVCKPWSSMINHSSFIDTHLKRRTQHNHQNGIVNLLISKRKNMMSFLSCLIKDGEYVYTGLMSPSLLESTRLQLIGTCNGLLCFACYWFISWGGVHPPVICNPSIRKMVILPEPSIICEDGDWYRQTHTFGYDARTNDYKVLRLIHKHGTPHAVEVYSLAQNSWKRLDSAAIPAYFWSIDWSEDIFISVNSALYWIKRLNEKRIIVSFDLATEMFSQIMIPEELGMKSNRILNLPRYYWERILKLSRYGESLALIVVEESIEIWVMKEVGGLEAWNHMFTINSCKYPVLIDPKSRSEVLFKTSESPRKMQRVNFETEQAEEFGMAKKYITIDSFHDSLVLLDQTNAVPY